MRWINSQPPLVGLTQMKEVCNSVARTFSGKRDVLLFFSDSSYVSSLLFRALKPPTCCNIGERASLSRPFLYETILLQLLTSTTAGANHLTASFLARFPDQVINTLASRPEKVVVQLVRSSLCTDASIT